MFTAERASLESALRVKASICEKQSGWEVQTKWTMYLNTIVQYIASDKIERPVWTLFLDAIVKSITSKKSE